MNTDTDYVGYGILKKVALEIFPSRDIGELAKLYPSADHNKLQDLFHAQEERQGLFQFCINKTLLHEGTDLSTWTSNEDEPVINNLYDPGGPTKYGISSRSNPDVDVNKLTLEEAIKIYYTKYYLESLEKTEILDLIFHKGPAYGKHLCLLLAKIFDASVLCGPKNAIKMLQRALNKVVYLFELLERLPSTERLVDDGIVGPKTKKDLSSIKSYSSLLIAMKYEMAMYLKSLGQLKFEKGWLERAFS